jgi:glycosyltransferase involved in cell wall biosynthesis
MVDLSVVIATIDAGRSIEACLRHLERSCAGMRTELLVVDASRDDTAARVASWGKPASLLHMPPGTLTPRLWAEGYRRSGGRVVAFTTGHCLVSPRWARSLLDAIEAGAAGAGGPLDLARDSGPLDWAVFYLRYSAFMPEILGAGLVEGEIAGDNAAYVREALDRHAGSFEGGFWEIEFHRRLRADGGWIAAAPAALVEFGRSFPIGTILRHRFAHARRFGAWRVGDGTRAAWQVVAAAPLVPLMLAGRTGSRVVRTARGRWRFVVSLPWFFLLASAWAAGEAWGAVSGACE